VEEVPTRCGLGRHGQIRKDRRRQANSELWRSTRSGSERQADEAGLRMLPRLRLPDDGGVILLDTFQSQPQCRTATEQRRAKQEHERKHSARHHQSNCPRQTNHRTSGLHSKSRRTHRYRHLRNVEQQDQIDKATQIAEKSKEQELLGTASLVGLQISRTSVVGLFR